MNWLWKAILMFFALTTLFTNAEAFRINDNFKWCEEGNIRDIWDIPEGCRTPLISKATTNKQYNILSKRQNEVQKPQVVQKQRYQVY